MKWAMNWVIACCMSTPYSPNAQLRIRYNTYVIGIQGDLNTYIRFILLIKL